MSPWGDRLGLKFLKIYGKLAALVDLIVMYVKKFLVLKKLAHGFYFVIPTTTKDQQGSWFIGFRHQGKDMKACLHQSRSMDHRRFYSKLGRLDDEDFSKVKEGFLKLYK